jgi:hypothetical protein
VVYRKRIVDVPAAVGKALDGEVEVGKAAPQGMLTLRESGVIPLHHRQY